MLCIPRELCTWWGEQSTHIAQGELQMELAAMLHSDPIVGESRWLWLVDNIADLMAPVSGNSDNKAFNEMAHFMQISMFAFRSVPCFEYVGS